MELKQSSRRNTDDCFLPCRILEKCVSVEVLTTECYEPLARNDETTVRDGREPSRVSAWWGLPCARNDARGKKKIRSHLSVQMLPGAPPRTNEPPEAWAICSALNITPPSSVSQVDEEVEGKELDPSARHLTMRLLLSSLTTVLGAVFREPSPRVGVGTRTGHGHGFAIDVIAVAIATRCVCCL